MREVADWMILNGYATGHGDTTADMLRELEVQSRNRAARPEALEAALRQRADEATRAENEACAKIADSFTCGLCGMDGKSAAAIRARIKP